MELRYIIAIAFAHWVADFIAQTDEMAQNKSSSNMWLGKHVLSYSLWMLGLTWVTLLDFSLEQIIPWVALNGSMHFVIDYMTSRASSKLYKEGDIHNFFVVIGFDQFLHLVCLLATFQYMILN